VLIGRAPDDPLLLGRGAQTDPRGTAVRLLDLVDLAEDRIDASSKIQVG